VIMPGPGEIFPARMSMGTVSPRRENGGEVRSPYVAIGTVTGVLISLCASACDTRASDLRGLSREKIGCIWNYAACTHIKI